MNRRALSWAPAALWLLSWGGAQGLEPPVLSSEKVAADNTRRIVVECDKQETIADALLKRGDHLLIFVKGTCKENVTINRDDVTLFGGAGSVLVGGVVVEDAHRVEIRGFTVRGTVGIDSSAIGVFHGSSATIEDMTVEKPEGRGIQIFTATAQVKNVRITGSGNVGLLFRGSSGNLDGDIISNDGGLAGISITLASRVFSKEGHIQVSGNPIGIIIQENSSLEIPLGSINASNNLRSGIEIQSHGMLNYGGPIEANNNGLFGLHLDELSSASPFRGFKPVTSFSNNNFMGVLAQRGSTVEFEGDTTIRGNKVFGILLEESGSLLSGAKITDNLVRDVRLTYDSHATFMGDPSTVTKMDCDASSLIRGKTCTPLP